MSGLPGCQGSEPLDGLDRAEMYSLAQSVDLDLQDCLDTSKSMSELVGLLYAELDRTPKPIATINDQGHLLIWGEREYQSVREFVSKDPRNATEFHLVGIIHCGLDTTDAVILFKNHNYILSQSTVAVPR